VGTIKIAVVEIDPGVGLNRDGACDCFNFLGVGETLFMPTEDGVIQGPMLATSYTVSPDLTTATVNVQRGVMFHKGWGEMTADDIVWSLNDANATTTPASIHPQAGDFSVLFREAQVIDDYTFELPFATFDPAWDGNRTNMFGNSFSVVSKKAYDENGADWSRENVIMTGPFEVEEYSTQERILVQAVPEHWRQTASINTLEVISIPESATRLASLLTGELDVTKTDFKDLISVTSAGFVTQGAGGGRKAGIFWGGNYWEDTTTHAGTGEPIPQIGLDYDPGLPWAVPVPVATGNIEEKMERARKVRWAMSLAIDRELINEAIMDGLAWPEYMWSASVTQREWQDRWTIPYDTAEAERMLDEAGYPRNSSGVRFQADIFRAAPDVDEISDAVAGFWSEVGIPTVVDKSAYTTMRPSLVNRSFVKINIQQIGETATNRPFDWPKGPEMTSLGRGGFGPGVEVDKITETIIAISQEPDRNNRIELNTELMDYMYHWMQGSAIVSLPDLLVYNPRSIQSWPMRNAFGLDYLAYPELIVPAR
jgi:ABC-type transport system substrate-binding protein